MTVKRCKAKVLQIFASSAASTPVRLCLVDSHSAQMYAALTACESKKTTKQDEASSNAASAQSLFEGAQSVKHKPATRFREFEKCMKNALDETPKGSQDQRTEDYWWLMKFMGTIGKVEWIYSTKICLHYVRNKLYLLTTKVRNLKKLVKKSRCSQASLRNEGYNLWFSPTHSLTVCIITSKRGQTLVTAEYFTRWS